ncbi:GNAT family N-acetyltransferase [Orbus sturtevantii]|uniref:GNAT family N-acetyltransferase n=1 Tax=Orbus sturtevantii TaxID=3074109 RepID=UPI00370D51C4
MKYFNQLEPNELIANFLSYPPIDFAAWQDDSGTPMFSAKFDLLTTADDDLKKRVVKLPFYQNWRKLLQPNTCFIGTTVSEYALFSQHLAADLLAQHIKQQYSKKFSLTIVKDLPQQSPLLDEITNNYAKNITEQLASLGFIEVEGQALAWVPIDFDDIDDYLSRLSHSRRKNFRRKLKLQSQLVVEVLSLGDRCFLNQQVLDHYYQLYLNVFEQSEIHFDLLSKPFFSQLLQNQNTNGKIFTYSHQGKLIGYNICFEYQNTLVDKYIGFAYPQAREFNLYYISWFYNLAYAKQRGLKAYIAGWTDPEVKASLGAKFTFTKHMVYVRNPVLRAILSKLSNKFESDRQWQDSINGKQS